MKFCAVLRSYPKDVPGGAEYQAYLICRELASRGHEAHYIAHQSDETSIKRDDKIVVHRFNRDEGTDLLASLSELQADVYYFRIAQDLPLLWRAKQCIDAEFVYNISRDVQCLPLFAGGPYQDSATVMSDLANRLRYATYRFLLRTPDLIFSQSNQQRTLLERNHSLQSVVIGNGHPVPDANFEKESPPVVLWLASLKEVKNPDTFIRLVEATSDLPCQFRIVGRPSNEEIHEYVLKKVSEHDNLAYLGGCGILESNEHFKNASVYVHTGDSEGFPNTFIQAWLHKTPVISFCANPDSTLEANEIGARCRTVDAAETTLRRLIKDGTYRKGVGATAREYGIAHHSIEVIVDKIERQLGNLIQPTLNDELN